MIDDETQARTYRQYRVGLEATWYGTVTITARSEEEAIALAQDGDGDVQLVENHQPDRREAFEAEPIDGTEFTETD